MPKIVIVPNEVLTSQAKPVGFFDKKLGTLVEEMKEALDAQVDPQGVGLAAPQIGVGLSVFIIKPTPKSSINTFVNPKILKFQIPNPKSQTNPKFKIKNKKQRRKHHFEGCLSIPRIWAPVHRAKKLLLEYQTVNGEKKTEWFTGFEATIIQHEVDHLNGILFTQRALEQNNQLYEEKEGKLEKLKY